MATRVIPLAGSRMALRRAEEAARRSSRLTVALLIPVGLLAVVGLGAILSASSVYALEAQHDSLFYFKRQLMWLGGGVVGLAAAAALPLRWWRRLAFPFFSTTVLLLVAVQLIGTRVGGAERWLSLGPIALQPSEFAKLATVLFLATLVSRREDSMHRFRDFLWPVAGSVGVVGALVIMQPDLGTTLLIAVGGFAVLAASAAPLAFVLGGGLIGAGGAVAAALVSPYRWERITSFLDVTADPLGSGYQAMQSLVALGTGGFFGVGLGASRARWSFLPNAHTDFIFAIVGEETGLAGTLAVVVLFVVLTVAGTLVALHSTDRFGRLAAIGITTWLAAQALVNVGGVTGVLPITGVPLPFVSFGGSALLTEMVAVGILVGIVRQPPSLEPA
jgi:cell division protein FtsW